MASASSSQVLTPSYMETHMNDGCIILSVGEYSIEEVPEDLFEFWKLIDKTRGIGQQIIPLGSFVKDIAALLTPDGFVCTSISYKQKSLSVNRKESSVTFSLQKDPMLFYFKSLTFDVETFWDLLEKDALMLPPASKLLLTDSTTTHIEYVIFKNEHDIIVMSNTKQSIETHSMFDIIKSFLSDSLPMTKEFEEDGIVKYTIECFIKIMPSFGEHFSTLVVVNKTEEGSTFSVVKIRWTSHLPTVTKTSKGFYLSSAGPMTLSI